MNGVAKEFWSEVMDLSRPVDDDGGRARPAKSRKKRVRRARRAASQTNTQAA